MGPGSFLDEHRGEVGRFVKHILPYIMVVLSILGFLVAAGWLDLPAKARDVSTVLAQTTSNKTHIDAMKKTVREIKVINAVTSQRLLSIDNQQRSMDRKLDKIIDNLIAGGK